MSKDRKHRAGQEECVEGFCAVCHAEIVCASDATSGGSKNVNAPQNKKSRA